MKQVKRKVETRKDKAMKWATKTAILAEKAERVEEKAREAWQAARLTAEVALGKSLEAERALIAEIENERGERLRNYLEGIKKNRSR